MLQRIVSHIGGFAGARRAAGTALAAVMLAAMGLGGCVGQQPYDDLMAENRTLKERNQLLQADAQAARSEADIEREQRRKTEGALAQLRQAYGGLEGSLDAANRAMRDLDGRIAGATLLDPATDRALTELASRYPDLIRYDPARGMLRFASDLTFDSGSDAVKPGARQSLQALAQILSSGAASNYEVHIVGHTDSQRISSNTAQRHPTNMHLSAHRAISVRRELADMSVPANRMMAAGWGEHQPAVPNSGNGNTPQNRRVEIFLTASGPSSSGGGYSTADVPIDRATPPSRQEDINK